MQKIEKTKKYLDLIEEITDSFKKIKNIRPLKENEIKYFNEEFFISASHNSNAIEGNTFTYDETRLLLKEGVATSDRSFKEHEEIVGYKEALDYIYKSLKEKKKITEDFIKKIHSFVLRGDNEGGEYRTIQNYIGDMFNIKYTPCPPAQVASKMKEYVINIQKDMDKNLYIKEQDDIDFSNLFHNLARHHIEFEKIHPFIDGNGRCGRLLLTYEIISLGFLPVDIRYSERKRYYAALACYEDKEKYSTKENSKTEKMAKLIAEAELNTMKIWISIFNKEKSIKKEDTEIEM